MVTDKGKTILIFLIFTNSIMAKIDYQKEAYDFFRNKGFNPVHSAAIAGNFRQESGFDPIILGDQGRSVGVAQWNGQRRKDLIKFAEDNNLDPSDRITQYEFVLKELNSTHKKAMDKLLATQSLADAVHAFNYYYEGSADSRGGKKAIEKRARRNRYNYAAEILGNNIWTDTGNQSYSFITPGEKTYKSLDSKINSLYLDQQNEDLIENNVNRDYVKEQWDSLANGEYLKDMLDYDNYQANQQQPINPINTLPVEEYKENNEYNNLIDQLNEEERNRAFLSELLSLSTPEFIER